MDRRLRKERAHEEDERSGLAAEEAAQRLTDRFWGLDKEVADKQTDLQAMAVEDRQSAEYRVALLELQQHEEWIRLAAKESDMKRKARLVLERQATLDYLQLFWDSLSSDPVIKYKWPTNVVHEHVQRNERTDNLQAADSPSTWYQGFALDAVCATNRVHLPVKAVHTNSSPAVATTGRRGGFSFVDVGLSFDLPSDPYAPPSQKLLPKVAQNNSTKMSKLEQAHAMRGKKMTKRGPRVKISSAGSPDGCSNNNTDEKLQEIRAAQGVGASSEELRMFKATAGKGGVLGLRLKKHAGRTAQVPVNANSDLNLGREEELLRQIFDCVDLDNSGAVDQEEMMTALREDQEVVGLVRNSKLLHPLLKKHTFKEAFLKMDSDGSGCVSWEEFRSFCVNKKDEAVQLQKVIPTDFNKEPNQKRTPKKQYSAEKRFEEAQREQKHRREQEILLREIFDKVDIDRSGTIEQEELLTTLERDPKVRKFAEVCPALQPFVLHENQHLIGRAFRAMDTDDESGVCFEEFVEFCLMLEEVL